MIKSHQKENKTMLRDKINKTVSHDKEIILMTNHNYFIRAAIVCVAKIAIASVVFGSLYAISTLFYNYEITSTKSTSSITQSSGIYGMWLFILAITFLVYFCREISKIVEIHRIASKIEDEILNVKE